MNVFSSWIWLSSVLPNWRGWRFPVWSRQGAWLLLLGCVLQSPLAHAYQVQGFVYEEGPGCPPDPNDPNQPAAIPLEGARVGLKDRQARVWSLLDGSFDFQDEELDPNQPLPSLVAAKVGWLNSRVLRPFSNTAPDGTTDAVFCLPPLPQMMPDTNLNNLSPDFCTICHQQPGYVEIVDQFSHSRHANAGQNPWVERVLEDYRSRVPQGEAPSYCADCHTPGAFGPSVQPGSVELTDVTGAARENGVQCITCHRVQEVTEDIRAINFNGGATLHYSDNSLFVFGPWDDVLAMEASYQPVFEQSLYCSTCHEYDAPVALGKEPVPGQHTYSEWLEWQARLQEDSPDKGSATCQSCHMPSVGPINAACSQENPRNPEVNPVRAHTFAGTWLGPGQTLPTGEYSLLENAAELEIVSAQAATDRLFVSVRLENARAGHKLPTGIDIRNMLLLVEVRDSNGTPLELLSERGPVLPDWASTLAGDRPDDYAGLPGKGYAKILSRDLEEYQDPNTHLVSFIEAECVVLDNGIGGGLSDTTSYVFRIPPGTSGPLQIQARALYRRAFTRFFERFEMERVDALGVPVSDFEMGRATQSVALEQKPAPLPASLTTDFQSDALGNPLSSGQMVNGAYSSWGVQISSIPAPEAGSRGCSTPDGNAYVVNLGNGQLGLSPQPGQATHNECLGGRLRLDFQPAAGRVAVEAMATAGGAGLRLRALDAQGKEVAVAGIEDAQADCSPYPEETLLSAVLRHPGIAAVEIYGTSSEAGRGSPTLWSLHSLELRHDPFEPLGSETGVLQIPTPTATPDPGLPTPTPSPTPAPGIPQIQEPLTEGDSIVEIQGLIAPGIRVELRLASDRGSETIILGSGTSDASGLVRIFLNAPLQAGQEVLAIELREFQSSASVSVEASQKVPLSTRFAFILFLMGTLLFTFRERRPAI